MRSEDSGSIDTVNRRRSSGQELTSTLSKEDAELLVQLDGWTFEVTMNQLQECAMISIRSHAVCRK